jgi:hypothetical protein
MYIYIWSCPEGVPFYVGLTKNKRRTNPYNSGSRNWLTLQRLDEVGVHNVLVEIRTVDSIVAGQELERKLIAEYGRIDKRTGTLTNLRVGGEGIQLPTEAQREKTRLAMLDPEHPIRSAAAREKQRKRMKDPDIQAKIRGENNPSKKPEVRQKLRELWQDSAFRERIIAARTGKKRALSDDTKTKLREAIKRNPAMKGWGERNGIDAAFEEKRLNGLKAAQPKRLEKMSDPAALEQRKARLKETMNSEAFKAKRAEWDTPEYRAKLSEAKRKYWANKKAAAAA